MILPALGSLGPCRQVKLCLVINKLDRLILELCLTPAEAYERLKAIVAHVNMIVSSFHSEKYISGEAPATQPSQGKLSTQRLPRWPRPRWSCSR